MPKRLCAGEEDGPAAQKRAWSPSHDLRDLRGSKPKARAIEAFKGEIAKLRGQISSLAAFQRSLSSPRQCITVAMRLRLLFEVSCATMSQVPWLATLS